MSHDTAPRHRYAVTFSVTLYVEAETEDTAATYAEEQLTNALDTDDLGSWRIEELAREDA